MTGCDREPPVNGPSATQCGGFFNLWRGARNKVRTLPTKLRRINKRRKMAAMLSEHTLLPQTPSCVKQQYRKTLAKRNNGNNRRGDIDEASDRPHRPDRRCSAAPALG